MALTPGTRLGPYEVGAPLGAGGMGEVYRARDTRLKRDVALKVLPDALSTDAGRVARFQREAEILATLSHPHIATVHGLEEAAGTRALVMELVEGETLAERLARGALRPADALALAQQLAEALDYAHEHGVLHRDLKPANLKVTAGGQLKVLDFGLARALEPAGGHLQRARQLPGDSPTITAPEVTQAGMILGTAAYMSPEQARGQAVDKRTDVWAFGCVLFEMLAGTPAFGGETLSDTLAAVLTKDPDWTRIPASTPPSVQRLLRACLARDPAARLRDLGDFGLVTSGNGEPGGAHAVPRPPVSRPVRVVAALLLALAGTGLGWIGARALGIESAAIASFTASIAAPVTTAFVAEAGSLALSPDGAQLAMVVSVDDGRRQLWLRSLRDGTARPLDGTDEAAWPFWSPDGRQVAYFADRKLKTVPVGGGPAVVVCDVPGSPRGGSWGTSGEILFARANGPGIERVPASGGTATAVTTVNRQAGELRHVSPVVLADGRSFVFTALRADPGGSAGDLQLVSAGVSGPVLLLSNAMHARVTDGQLLFVRERGLLTMPFASGSGLTDAPARPLAGGLRLFDDGAPAYSASGDVLVHMTSSTAGSLAQLTWLDRAGTILSTVGEPDLYGNVELSPDETRVLVRVTDRDGGIDFWIIDVTSGRPSRFTFGPDRETRGLWSPDGRQVLFSAADATGKSRLYVKPADGAGTPRVIVDREFSVHPDGWSPDGRYLLYGSPSSTQGTGNGQLWRQAIDSGAAPEPFAPTPFDESQGHISTDGQWVAYASNETGRQEVYVAPFVSGSGARWQVSTGGGRLPRWRPGGGELFFLSPEGAVMAVTTATDRAAFRFEAPRRLFTVPGLRELGGTPMYAVSRDGERILMARPVDSSRSALSVSLRVGWQASPPTAP